MLLVLRIFLIVRKSKSKLLRWISQHCVKLISTFKSPHQKFLLTEVLLTKFYWRQAELLCSHWSSMLSDQSGAAEAFHFIACREIYKKVQIQFATLQLRYTVKPQSSVILVQMQIHIMRMITETSSCRLFTKNEVGLLITLFIYTLSVLF